MTIDPSQSITEEEARALLLNRPKRTIDLDVSLPDLSQLDGQLALQELSAFAVSHARKLVGEDDDILLGTAMVLKSLILRSNKKRIFKDSDVEAVENFGLSVLMPMITQVKDLSALGTGAEADTKKNSQTGTTSPTSSTETAEQQPPASV